MEINVLQTAEVSEIRTSLADCKEKDRYIIGNGGRRYWVFGHTEDGILCRRIEGKIMLPLYMMPFENLEKIEPLDTL